MELSLACLAGSHPKPLSVLCCSESIDLVEAELQHALLVNVGSAHPAVQLKQVVELVARTYNVYQAGMTIVASSLNDYPLLLLSGATTDRVFKRGERLHGLTFSLFFKRWSRLALAEAAVQPVPIDIEL
jgi:hypothetical protein